MSILGFSLTDWVFIIPSALTFGFATFEYIKMLCEAVPAELPQPTLQNIIRMSETEILNNFKTVFSNILMYSETTLKNNYDILFKNELFVSCIRDWIFLKNDNDLNVLLCNSKYNLNRTELKNLLISLSNCNDTNELKSLNIGVDLLELILLNIEYNIDSK